MGNCNSLSTVPVFVSFGSSHEQLSKEQIHMVDTYLPDFRLHEQSSELHRQLAAMHWDTVFMEKRASVSRMAQSYSAAKLPVASEREHARESTGRETSMTTQTGSKIGELYDAFYSYLDDHSPELKPLFPDVTPEHVADKIAALTKTHVHFGVRLEHFNPLGMALLHAMAVVSEDTWTSEVAGAWRRLFAHCSAMLMVHLKKMTDATP